MTFGDLFTRRQLVALNTFSELVGEAMELCQRDAASAGFSTDTTTLDQGGSGALAYGQSLAIYLAFSLNKMADRGSSICTWFTERDSTRNTFARQSLPMTWDFAELNTLVDGTGTFYGANLWTAESLEGWSVQSPADDGIATQSDAKNQSISVNKVISTDPPYYDNIGYADLSDFFYVWLRRALRPILPGLYATVAVPKQDELVATPYRHGGKKEAETFFLDGMTEALHNLADQAHPAFPVTIYYAFKQSDTNSDDATSSSGWVTFLEAVSRAGFALNGTWPMRTELGNRMIGSGNNALASSIVLVCRKRSSDAPTISRREFLRELHAVLPDSLIDMTRGGVNSPVAPVDLSQAIIGPGMGIFSKYKAVLEADGTPMTVRTALQLINRFLADDEFDPETQFCLQWFETNFWNPGIYGSADVAARAKGTSVDALFRAGVVNSGGGEVQLLRWNELPTDWKPDPDQQTPVWEALHQLIRNLNMHGEQSAGALLAGMSAVSGPVRTLAYRLYTLCERKGLAEDARFYNELIGAWAAIEVVADEIGPIEKQGELF
jgi:putative DNA methylase